ncbi:indolepyruvate oxidoreductase subunit IorA [Desulfosarcina ovata subsp. sediminis]|uniref:Indolepyruvate oxidoreductase subunit IorA n=1 Tax=Desulfosarcina ovata subsp. sediminis TaxID=885957 RepID=A0A5K7ZMN0_9BACT|nr:thiamine pyrophosphate-dependent enzyme [Desulfosarcina ovata]BBO82824.1 indolepyruvate oxidoreductase subunit IorA [Desulfosarcina ovata subsp. sediminis]
MNQAENKLLMMGNEAIARGLVENGCSVATAYPGTPSSEILSSIAMYRRQLGIDMHTQWAVNEKIAFEIAYAGSQAGLRTAVSMKQVGLNVASDPLMSAAYMGCVGGFIIISADDPGPHSSQTEQDSRMLAVMAKIPVLDPDSPGQAKAMVGMAYDLSETFKTPVMLRPTTRVCHSRQDVQPGDIPVSTRQPDFKKDPLRWAATPKFRYQLHLELEAKLADIARQTATAPLLRNPQAGGRQAVVASGVAAAYTAEALNDLGLWERLPFYQVLQPFPLHTDFMKQLLAKHDDVLILEESTGIIEMQLADHRRVRGKLNHVVPRVGELLPEKVERLLADFTGQAVTIPELPPAPGRRPTLCAGCPHRASFFAIKKAAPRGIYTSDIGCYTLGLNLEAVDTVLCMGAAISQAAGFYHAYRNAEKRPDVVATIGDSTFFHAGLPALIDAVNHNVRFVLVILDNRTTAMTGSQPTPATGSGVSGEALVKVDMETLIKGCGVEFLEVGDPYDLANFTAMVKKAVAFSRSHGPAVVIARHPCIIDLSRQGKGTDPVRVTVNDDCDGCGYCLQHFECPALVAVDDGARTAVDPLICTGCGVCLNVCPKGAIVADR